jgi:bacterioferritin (cytochrome b1)
MELKTLIERLNEDLGREYAHWHFYTNAAVRVTGLHRKSLSDFFREAAKGEAEHIHQFATVILGLGGTPTTRPDEFLEKVTDPEALLREALFMEEQVVENYVERLDDLEKLGEDEKANAVYLRTFLEQQVADSRSDLDELKLMLGQ